MDFQIHCIETEAYGAVLRAFIAQSEVLSWDKEELITELRKELRVSDVEHREILAKINLDDSIKSIREWRKGSDGQHLSAMNPPAYRKRLKPEQMPVAPSPKYLPRPQPSPMHIRDGLWNSNTAILSPQIPGGQPLLPVPQNRQSPSFGKVRGSVAMKTSKKGVAHSGFGNMKPGSDIFEIRATDKLINEVEMICGGVNPDPSQIERARLILREHERALMDAIGKLADVSDGDDSPVHRQKQHQYSNEERDRNILGFRNCAYQQFDRSKAGYGDGYIVDHVERAGIPCIDIQDDLD